MQSGCGLVDNPLHLEWINGEPSSSAVRDETPFFKEAPAMHFRPSVEDLDYEAQTLLNLRQAQERKLLAEQNKDQY